MSGPTWGCLAPSTTRGATGWMGMGSKDSDIAGEMDGGDWTQSAGIYKWHHGGNWIVKEPVAAASNGKGSAQPMYGKELGLRSRNRMPSGGIFLDQNRAVCQLNTVKHELKTKP